MAEKNWLIRTKNKQILGPATKQKIIELIEKGSLTGEDEVTSGNGYWFWIKETDLLDKYIYGDKLQTFNPISEAKSVLIADGATMPVVVQASNSKASKNTGSTSSSCEPVAAGPKTNESLFPGDEDLEYPDIDINLSNEDKTGEINLGTEENAQSGDEDSNSGDDVTRLDLSDLSGQIAAMKAESSDLIEGEEHEYPEDGNGASDDDLSDLPKKKTLFRKKMTEAENSAHFRTDKNLSASSPAGVTKQRNDKYLFFIFVLAFFLIGIVFYYYRMVLNKPIPLVGISEVHAQTMTSRPITISKKKTFLRPKI